jgi:adenylosuccinate synthase
VTTYSELKSLTAIGGQWGDEGKGKVVDLLSSHFQVVVRFNGGHNAGHTVRFADRRFALHLVPSGIIHESTLCYLGAGMVIDPTALGAELDTLNAEGVKHEGRLFLSDRATLILPTHQAIDAAREGARGKRMIGTTGRGIGPAYQDAAQRRALRTFLLTHPDRLIDGARDLMTEHNRELDLLYGASPVDIDKALETLRAGAERLGPLVQEIGPKIIEHAESGKQVLFEGAQGVLLDIHHGTYPYVTSSSCLPGAAAVSCAISPRYLGPVLGIMKAYVTRVGSGPFPSELEDEVGERLRERGNEFGTTTGRPRRCGWFDAVAARYAVRAAGIDAIALMKLDILDELAEVKVVVGYELPDGRVLDTMPADLELLAQVRPRTETLPGWKSSTRDLTEATALPARAEAYVRFLERQVGVPIVLVSIGPRREETIPRGDCELAKQLAALMDRSV